MNCQSCGMSMESAEEHGGGDMRSNYCRCCAPRGILKSREEVRQGWINALIEIEHISREEAEKKVSQVMFQMPAWRD